MGTEMVEEGGGREGDGERWGREMREGDVGGRWEREMWEGIGRGR
jgi:hypothetical protein